MEKIKTFVNRLNKIGINVKVIGNLPWIYVIEINGKAVTEKFQANHGFTIAFLNMDNDVVFFDTMTPNRNMDARIS